MKVKLIHDWICASISYDATMLKQGMVTNQDVQTVLATRKAVCSGYSRVFQSMADFAGIPCVTVSGFVKNQRGARGLSQDNSHAWNLVQVYGRWHIVDTTFDAGYVKDWVFVKKYSTENLFVDPAQSIYARYPKESGQQLLASPISGQDFLNLPDVEPAFFDYGLEFDSKRIAWENPTLGLFCLELKGNDEDMVIDGVLIGPDGKELPGATFIQRPGAGRYSILASMTQKASYTLEIYAKRRGEARFDYLIDAGKFEGKIVPALDKADRVVLSSLFEKIPASNHYRFKEDPFSLASKDTALRLLAAAGFPADSLQKVLSLKLLNQRASATSSYPKVYARYQNSTADSLASPLLGTLKVGEEVRFAYRSEESKEAALIMGDKFYTMKKGSDGIFSLSLKIPASGRISLGLSENGIDYDIALSWEAVPKP
ncbi:MAG: transglutaminase domain-containing protein [Spirochaetes bacterium]|nr:MAG: transglutaminase domain-containing protein [Spirochaetota bacterium]